jgi:hypothetical protein
MDGGWQLLHFKTSGLRNAKLVLNTVASRSCNVNTSNVGHSSYQAVCGREEIAICERRHRDLRTPRSEQSTDGV